MKKATLGSIAVWGTAALVLIGYQLAGQRWSALFESAVSHAVTWVSIGLIVASMSLMKDVPSRELGISSANTRTRNLANALNIIAAVSSGLSFAYLAGLFGPVRPGSPLFPAAASLLLIGTLFQAGFAVATNQSSD